MLRFDIAGAQIDGARDYQEDAFLITRVGESVDSRGASMLIVADGMGGHAAGNVASNMAVQTFNKFITSRYPVDDLPRIMREAVRQANLSITETVRETAALKGMGCTLVAAIADEQTLRWLSVGDSHLYLVRDGELRKLNADHSYGGFLDRMAAAGKPVEAEAGFSRNMLMSALTGEDISEIDCPEFGLNVQAGDRLIVASDGLDTLSSRKILELMGTAKTARECCESMLKAVQDAGLPRQDNTTIVVAMIDEPRRADPTDATTEMPAATPTLAIPSRSNAPAEEAEPGTSGGLSPGILLTGVVLALLILGGMAWVLLGKAPAPKPEIPPGATIEESVPKATTAAKPAPAAVPVEEKAATPPVPKPVAATPVAPPDVKLTRFTDPAGGSSGPTMVAITSGGKFSMGSIDSSVAFDESPRHDVTLKPFAIGVTEVTVGEYARFAQATGRKVSHNVDMTQTRNPMVFVSWEDAVAYTQWLSTATGKRYRLPSEAEWEFAAAAGSNEPYWWGRELESKRAHCMVCQSGFDLRKPVPVGQFAANPFGLYDTAGNVEEWVADCYQGSYKNAPADGVAVEQKNCQQRVVRGGAFSSGPKGLRSVARNKFSATSKNDSIGFRVARDW